MEHLARGSYDRGERVARKLRSRLWLERGLFLVVVCAGLVYYGFASRTYRGACVIAIAGKPAVVVASQAAAEHVLAEVKRAANPSGEGAFDQLVTLHRVSGQGSKVVSEADAIRDLTSRLTVVTSGVGLYINGRLLYGFADRAQATGALSLLLKELSPPDPDLTRTIQGKVKIAAGPIPAAQFLPSADAAIDRIREQMATRQSYTVRGGDSPWKIASDHRITIDQLRQANPHVDFLHLKAGDQVAIPTGRPPISVIAWKEMEEPIGAADGGKTQTVRVSYLNGTLTERQVVRRPLRPEEARRQERRERSAYRRRSPSSSSSRDSTDSPERTVRRHRTRPPASAPESAGTPDRTARPRPTRRADRVDTQTSDQPPPQPKPRKRTRRQPASERPVPPETNRSTSTEKPSTPSWQEP